ncbi:hypothetical protein E2C01_032142 [Portunus trituberculatus]|uniref:Uncharacterized protein n=1 Tax=Portunus trituberculatus TaxID=210409 RepID=A0A5B7EVA3_PORTR|nr:hypothetical protein [Portunus trituberculatus]
MKVVPREEARPSPPPSPLPLLHTLIFTATLYYAAVTLLHATEHGPSLQPTTVSGSLYCTQKRWHSGSQLLGQASPKVWGGMWPASRQSI